MHNTRILLAAFLLVQVNACGASPAQRAANVPPSAPPASTVIQISVSEAVAGGPSPPGHTPAAYLESYRIEGVANGFQIVKVMSDGTRADTAPVTAEKVSSLLALASKHRADLHCVDGVSRASYLTGRIVVAGPVNLNVQSDCQGTHEPQASAALSAYKAFHVAYERLRDETLRVSESAFAAVAK